VLKICSVVSLNPSGLKRDLVGFAWAAARVNWLAQSIECAALPLQGDQTVGQLAAEECRVCSCHMPAGS